MRRIAAISIVILCLTLMTGCMSASSSTGASSEGRIEGKQGTSQATTSADTVKLEIPSTTITITDRTTGNVTIITTGGGRAETGSKSVQETEANQKIAAEIKANAEATAKSSFNINVILVIVGILLALYLVISVGSRTFLKKFFI